MCKEIKERPILFSTEMVRAIRDDKKTQTRRLMDYQPPGDFINPVCCFIDYSTCAGAAGQWVWKCKYKERHESVCYDNKRFRCPYGRVGDRLWVKETFSPLYIDESKKEEEPNPLVIYKSDEVWDDGEHTWKWKPSIFMPRRFAKHLLEITEIRVERLQNIYDEDALKEGVFSKSFRNPENTFYRDYEDGRWLCSPRNSFRTLWNSINGQNSWAADPFVWVITFERIY